MSSLESSSSTAEAPVVNRTRPANRQRDRIARRHGRTIPRPSSSYPGPVARSWGGRYTKDGWKRKGCNGGHLVRASAFLTPAQKLHSRLLLFPATTSWRTQNCLAPSYPDPFLVRTMDSPPLSFRAFRRVRSHASKPHQGCVEWYHIVTILNLRSLIPACPPCHGYLGACFRWRMRISQRQSRSCAHRGSPGGGAHIVRVLVFGWTWPTASCCSAHAKPLDAPRRGSWGSAARRPDAACSCGSG